MDDCAFIQKLALEFKIFEISKKYLDQKTRSKSMELFAKPKWNGLSAPCTSG